MENKPKKSFKEHKRLSKKSTPARKVGYIFAIIFMIIFLYVVKHLREWGVTFLTEDFETWIFYFQLSMYASIAGQVLFILYDNRWFKHLIQGIVNVFSALSLIMLYVIYPFDFAHANWDKWIKILLLFLFVVTVISIVVEVVKGIRYLISNPERE